jgi:hypothetical protein
VASLWPRRWPKVGPKPFEALLDCVLDLLGSMFVPLEEVEPVEAVEVWRSGEGEAVECPSLVRGE